MSNTSASAIAAASVRVFALDSASRRDVVTSVDPESFSNFRSHAKRQIRGIRDETKDDMTNDGKIKSTTNYQTENDPISEQ